MVSIQNMPHFITSKEQFQLVVRLSNTTDRKYNLHLTLSQVPDSGMTGCCSVGAAVLIVNSLPYLV